MGHGHDHSRKAGVKAVVIALIITFVFALTQVIGGWIANSLALMADAAHMATDCASFGLTLFAFWIAARPATPRMSYGFYRAEILGALASATFLWVICAFLIYEAIRRIISPPPVEGGIVFIIACITLVFNLITMRILHGPQKDSLNVKAAYLHVLSDLLGNIGVIIAGGIIWLTHWYIADPILTILFTALILFSSGRMMWEAIEILMEASPRKIDPQAVYDLLLSLPSISEVHDLHLWTVSSGRVALSAHLVAEETDLALDQAHRALSDQFHIEHQTLQVEHPSKFAAKYCADCQLVDS